MENQQLLLGRAWELSMPLLVFHGIKDSIVDYTGSQEIYNAAQTEDKELHLYEGLYHETMNERLPERELVLDTVAGWIKRHI